MDNSQLTIADLASLHSMLEAAASRGAFRANEMTQVGQVYDKLSEFLKAIREKAEAQQPAQPQGDQNA